MHQHKNKNVKHVPVLLDEVLQCLDPKVGDSYLDLTAGYGGHAREILAATLHPELAVLVDRDKHATDELQRAFKGQRVSIRRQDFLAASEELANEQESFDVILADLGVSSPHLNEADRGFAIALEGPLDMRMDESQALSAETIVNSYSEAELADILWRYGEEPKARQIARLITGNRPFTTTTQLAAVVAKAWSFRSGQGKPGRSRVHPATRTFQALRIAVNDELRLLELALPLWIQLLKPGGRIAVISFHSLEDALVKRVFQEASGERYDAELRLLTKRPITASNHELVTNPRARSAKLRAAAKINNQKKGE